MVTCLVKVKEIDKDVPKSEIKKGEKPDNDKRKNILMRDRKNKENC